MSEVGQSGGDVAGHADDVVDDDRLATVDDAGRDRPHRTDGAGGDGPERHLEVPVGQLALEPPADLVELDAQAAGDRARSGPARSSG